MKVTALLPFVPSGPDFAASLTLFQDLGFTVDWNDAGYAGLRHGAAAFILQSIDEPAWASQQMLVLEVDDLDAWWAFASALDLPARHPGVRMKPPTDFPWGREVHFIDLAGVCWHVRKGA